LKIRSLTPRARISATVGVIAVGALALSGCAGDSGSANYVEGGTFVYALGTDIGSFDPALGVTSAALAVGQYAYDPLVVRRLRRLRDRRRRARQDTYQATEHPGR